MLYGCVSPYFFQFPVQSILWIERLMKGPSCFLDYSVSVIPTGPFLRVTISELGNSHIHEVDEWKKSSRCRNESLRFPGTD
jgi:hypothetical protein